MFVKGRDLAENLFVSSNSRRNFFIKVDHINSGDTGPAHVKLDAIFLSDKPKICP